MKNLIDLLGKAELQIGKSKGLGLGALYLLLIWLTPFGLAVIFKEPAVAGLAPLFHAIGGQS